VRDTGIEAGRLSAALDLLSKGHIVPDVSQRWRVLTETVARQRSSIIAADKQEAARTLGMSRATIYRKINDYANA
jgi:DNA-binding NtrC family response regulator